MTTFSNDYCVILAGGKGRRLWPCSRSKHPKQFVDFFSTGRTLLQSTFDRMSKIIPAENIYVSTNHEYAHYVVEQLPELPSDNVLSEPIHRNTAPSVAWATYRIFTRNANARIVVVPSDHAVFKEQMFEENVRTGLELVGNNNKILVLGVKPTRPEPGYGYIQVGNPLEGDSIFGMKSFTEKPDRQFAEMFMLSGEFLWNTGIYLANARFLSECLRRLFPAILRKLGGDSGNDVTLKDELLFIEEHFSAYPNMSLDFALLEQNQNENLCVMRCDFGWADLGMWHSIYESLRKSNDDNVVIDSRVILDECKGNIIKLPKDHMGIINALDGYIVAEQGNVLLICKKGDSSAAVRKYLNEMQIKYGDEFI